eukprot:Hpha_TRINITY_DN5737_c0_g1::TRINITY_DN5737_c0_g1_i1::g.147479::m.147479
MRGWQGVAERSPNHYVDSSLRVPTESFIPPRPADTFCLQENPSRRGAGAARSVQPPGSHLPLSPPTSPLSPQTPEKLPLRPFQSHFTPPALQVETHKHVPGRFEWAVMDAFQFGDPPSPSSQARTTKSPPPLGTVMRAPKDPTDQNTEKVLPRFHALIVQLVRLTGDTDPSRRGDLLPHLSVSDVVRQVVKRLNWFSDTGAAKQSTFKPVWSCFCDLIRNVFCGRLGKDVRQTALTDLLGCVFDIELMPEVVPVDLGELGLVRDRIYGYSCATACVSALLSMMRHQHTESAHLNDSRSVGVVVTGIVALARRVGDARDGDPFPVLKELQRFCDYPDPTHGVDLFTRLSREGFCVSDSPAGPRPSPLGAARALAAAVQETWGKEVVAAAIASLAAGGRPSRLALLFNTPIPPNNPLFPAAKSTPITPPKTLQSSFETRRTPHLHRVAEPPPSSPSLRSPPAKAHHRTYHGQSEYPAPAPKTWRPATTPPASAPPSNTSARVAARPQPRQPIPTDSSAALGFGGHERCERDWASSRGVQTFTSHVYQPHSMCRPEAGPTHTPRGYSQHPQQGYGSQAHCDTNTSCRTQEMDWYEKQSVVQRRVPLTLGSRGGSQYSPAYRRDLSSAQMQWISQTA